MGNDDDLFEDNDIIVVEESIIEDYIDDDEPDTNFSSLSDHEKEWFGKLREILENTSSFSFSLYTNIYAEVIRSITESKKMLKVPTGVVPAALVIVAGSDEYSLDQMIRLKENQRAIILGGFYMRCLEQMSAALLEHPRAQEPKTFVQYMSEKVNFEFQTAVLYLNELIEEYQDFCKDNNIEIDQLLCNEQALSYATVQDRMSFGHAVPAAKIELIGPVKNWEEARLTQIKAIKTTSMFMINYIDDMVTKIRNGDSSVKDIIQHEH